VVLATIVFFLYVAHRAALSGLSQAQHRCYVWAAGMAGFELVYNAGGIVLSRYLYLLTVRRPGLTTRRAAARASDKLPTDHLPRAGWGVMRS
jgi:hypothetical protein